jgi:hypothetical protein
VPPVGNTPKPPPQGEGHGRRGRGQASVTAQAVAGEQADPTRVVERALEGQTSRGLRPSLVSARDGTNAPVGSKLWSRRSAFSLSGGTGRSKRQESTDLERGADHRDGEALKTKPQERYRGEIDPDGVAGCKPSRACETPRTEGGGQWRARGDRTRDSRVSTGGQVEELQVEVSVRILVKQPTRISCQ